MDHFILALASPHTPIEIYNYGILGSYFRPMLLIPSGRNHFHNRTKRSNRNLALHIPLVIRYVLLYCMDQRSLLSQILTGIAYPVFHVLLLILKLLLKNFVDFNLHRSKSLPAKLTFKNSQFLKWVS